MTDNITCGSQHQQLLEWIKKLSESIGTHQAHIETSVKNQEILFEKIQNLQSTLDRRVDLPLKIDKLSALVEDNQDEIRQIQATLENGLTAKAHSTEAALTKLSATVEQFISQHNLDDAMAEAGIDGWLRKALSDWSKQMGPIIISIIVGLVAWGSVKALVFKEFPFPVTTNVPAVMLQHGGGQK